MPYSPMRPSGASAGCDATQTAASSIAEQVGHFGRHHRRAAAREVGRELHQPWLVDPLGMDAAGQQHRARADRRRPVDPRADAAGADLDRGVVGGVADGLKVAERVGPPAMHAGGAHHQPRAARVAAGGRRQQHGRDQPDQQQGAGQQATHAEEDDAEEDAEEDGRRDDACRAGRGSGVTGCKAGARWRRSTRMSRL
jgi:hypothetical protein